MDSEQYEAQCRAAATAQGLDPMMKALGREGIAYALEQTGGFCMAVSVPKPAGTWVLVNEDGWCASWFPGNAWNDGGEPDYARDAQELSFEEVLELVD